MENLKLKDFVDYKSLSNPTFSPNGENIAFNVHSVNLEDNKFVFSCSRISLTVILRNLKSEKKIV